MNSYIIAVSGGVDSVVLLAMAMKWPSSRIIVAHFDHGIRPNSAEDAAFVRRLAAQYGVPFESERVELGEGASEEKARLARYTFLRRIAEKYGAQLVTAHHKDDVLETVFINIIRGTGWRGLCSLRSGEVYRPLLAMDKSEITAFANKNGLTWREDATNSSERYLRNYLRHNVVSRLNADHRNQLFALYEAQCRLADAIRGEMWRILEVYSSASGIRRYIFIMADGVTARELLREAIFTKTGKTVTRPQLTRALLAIKILQPGTRYQVGQGIELKFSRTHMIVEETRNW